MHKIRRYRRERRYRALQRSIVDARSGEVVFVSHCLLNQNTRYLGGAVCPGVVAAAIAPYIEDGTGIVQMPCPEQRVWGGVLKTRMLCLIQHPRIARAARWCGRPCCGMSAGGTHTTLARSSADVEDYQASGLSVRGLVGVAGSPSCGVHTTLDLPRAAGAVACRRREPATATWMNTTVVQPALCPGRGMFVEELTRAMERRGVDVPMLEEEPAGRDRDEPCARSAESDAEVVEVRLDIRRGQVVSDDVMDH